MSTKPTDADLEGMDIFDKPETVKGEDYGLDMEEEEEDNSEFSDWPYDKELNFEEGRPAIQSDLFEETNND